MTVKPPASESPFESRSAFYVDNRLVVIPIAPGTKKPGAYSQGQWHNMKDWNRFFGVSPTPLQIDSWCSWPEAGIGLLLGKLSGVIAVDIDTDDLSLISQIQSIMPPSPVRKKGKKGFTAFYRYNGEVPRSWDVNKERVVDLLSEGRQTLMPGTQHPDGMSYVYLTDDTLEEFDISSLPTLSPMFGQDLDRILEPLQTPEDKVARRERAPVRDEDPNAVLLQGIASQLWKTINSQALDRLDDWVPMMISGAKPDGKGYRCRAYWRGAENPNVGIHHTGIRDFGNGVGLTPIDLVMFAMNTNFSQASEMLRKVLKIGGDNFQMRVNPAEPAPRPDEPSVDLTAFMENMKTAPSVRKAPQAPQAPAKVAPQPIMPRADIDPLVAAQERREAMRLEEVAAQASLCPEFIANAPGIIGEVADWINATAPKHQPEFAVAAALTLGAAVMGRKFRSDRNNFTSLFFVIVAESGGGKDHPQKCVRNLLSTAGLGNLLGGSGYTSASAVFSGLLIQPSHVAIIDEFGQLLKSSGKNNSQNTDSALTKLMEVWTNLDNQVMPQQFSQLSLPKKEMEGASKKTVHNPAITMLCATTPAVFFGALVDDHISGGFLNRFVLVQTNQPRVVGVRPQRIPAPETVIDWCKELVAEHAAGSDLKDLNDPGTPAKPIEMTFSPEAEAILNEFAHSNVAKQNSYDSAMLADLLVRTQEKAQRVAMIVAKGMNAPRDNVIGRDAMAWAIKYVQHYDYRMVTAVETQRPQSRIMDHLKQVERIIKNAKKYETKAYAKVTATGAMPHSLLLQKMKVDKREMTLIMETAIDSGLVYRQEGLPEIGFAGVVYFLRGSPD